MKNWVKSRLVEVCKIGDGNHSSNYPKSNEMVLEGIPFIRANNMVNGHVTLNDMKFITKEKHAILKKGHLKAGDILFTNRGEIGKIAIVGNDFENANLNSQIAWFRCFDKLENRFLYYYLLSPLMQNHYLVEKNGAALQQFTIRQINEIEIPIPPLPEQQRIVSILDEAFAAIAKAKANAEQNLKNAKELFESYLQGLFEKGNWQERVLGDLCLLITKGSSPKWQGVKYVDSPGILFVTSENVGEAKMLLETKKYVEEKFNQKDKKSILKKGDVLTNIVGASIGRTAIYDIDDIANINQAVCILRCNPKWINNVFLMNLLNSPFLKRILHDNEVNNARANLSLGFFNKLSIPCPSIAEQQTIVRQLAALQSETQKLEQVYQKKINFLEELKKSILQKAFAGELKTEKVFAE